MTRQETLQQIYEVGEKLVTIMREYRASLNRCPSDNYELSMTFDSGDRLTVNIEEVPKNPSLIAFRMLDK